MNREFTFDEEKNPWQLGFYESLVKIAGFTGGFGNGKTAALAIIGLSVARTYEKARILVGRATRPKLEDSTKPEVMKWIPEDWIAKMPNDRHNNLVIQETGSQLEFRHIRQEGKGKGEQQSNLLSATYDLILVDQMDDPELSYKDFADLVGRLRGTARYIGDDPRMPKFGPQLLRFTANPTRNWLFREVAGPFFTWEKSGLVTSKLLRRKSDGQPIIKVFNAPTSANAHNTGAEYAETMETVFRGAMGARFIEGDWGAYEGLIYPEYDETIHRVQASEMEEFIKDQLKDEALGIIEGYDYGQASPSCYLLAFHNDVGDIFIVDGFYEANAGIKKQVKWRQEILNKWGVIPTERPYADPDIFRKKSATKEGPAIAVATLFAEEGLDFQRGANDIDAGIAKIASYLAVDKLHRHPITRNYGGPRLFVSSDMEFWHNEIVDYYWNKNTLGQNVDKPVDRNDHAMDGTKYLLSKRPSVVGAITKRNRLIDPRAFMWNEAQDDPRGTILPRHM